MLSKIFRPFKDVQSERFPGVLLFAKLLYALGIVFTLGVLMFQVPKLIVGAFQESIGILLPGFVLTTYAALKAPVSMMLISIFIAISLQIEQHFSDLNKKQS